MFGRTRPFEPPVEELSAQSQGFSPGYEPSARNVLRVKPGYPTPLVESAGVAADRVRAHKLDAYKALDKFVSYLIGQRLASKFSLIPRSQEQSTFGARQTRSPWQESRVYAAWKVGAYYIAAKKKL